MCDAGGRSEGVPSLPSTAARVHRKRSVTAIFGPFATLTAIAALPAISHASPPSRAMRPAASSEGYVVTESAQVLPSFTPSASLLTGWGQFSKGPSPSPDWNLKSRTSAHFLAAVGLFHFGELSLDLPMVLHQSAERKGNEQLAPAAFGDLRSTLKGTIVHARSRGLGVGVAADFYWPTGSDNALSSHGTFAAAFSALAEYHLYRGITAAVNLGYLARPKGMQNSIAYGHLFSYRIGGKLPFGRYRQFDLVAEVDGAAALSPGAASPIVARAGLNWRSAHGLMLGLFGGAGTSSYESPGLQGMLRIAFIPAALAGRQRAFVASPRPSARELARNLDRIGTPKPAPTQLEVNPNDPDGDGRLAAADLCPHVAEDFDGYQDQDGCPDHDNDGDHFPDDMDLCPLAPELTNGYRDWDGCPDQRLANGSGKTLKSLDPARLVPKLTWIAKLDRLTPESQAQLKQFVELLRINPWLGPIAIELPKINPTQTSPAQTPAQTGRAHNDQGQREQDPAIQNKPAAPPPKLALAKAREQVLRKLLLAPGIDPQQIQFLYSHQKNQSDDLQLAWRPKSPAPTGHNKPKASPAHPRPQAKLATQTSEEIEVKAAKPDPAKPKLKVMGQGPALPPSAKLPPAKEDPAPKPRPATPERSEPKQRKPAKEDSKTDSKAQKPAKTSLPAPKNSEPKAPKSQ